MIVGHTMSSEIGKRCCRQYKLTVEVIINRLGGYISMLIKKKIKNKGSAGDSCSFAMTISGRTRDKLTGAVPLLLRRFINIISATPEKP